MSQIKSSAKLSPDDNVVQSKSVNTIAGSGTIVNKDAEQPKLSKSARRRKKWEVRLKNFMVNEGTKAIFLIVYFTVMISMFFDRFFLYLSNDNYASFRSVVGLGLPIARGAAGAINFNLACILFPVCRNIISKLRTTVLNTFIPFDKNITWHKLIAGCTVFFTFVHICAHMFNLLNFQKATGTNAGIVAMFWGTGFTGQVATLAFFLMVTSSMEGCRRANFELFWYTHHLFIIFFVALIAHGQFCFIKADRAPQCNVGGTFWRWFVAGGFFYLIERILREVRGRQPTHIHKIVLHPSKVVEVQIKKPSAKMKAGQYIFVNCAEISPFQWHPFTLTSAPEEDFISVHMRVVGDWTEAFGRRVGIKFSAEDAKAEPLLGDAAKSMLPAVMVDGPYGSASEDVFKYEVAVLVGAGIGVTPFASILKSIWYRAMNPTSVMKLRKVYFYWICRDKEAFEWFQDLLVALETEELENFLEINTYLTAPLKPNEIRNVILNTGNKKDAVTGLKSPTLFGRPNFDDIFEKIRTCHQGTDIGVFFCGPKVLSGTLHTACNKWTSAEDWGTKFYYHKENF
ncbi:ferric reductase NAD binding domain-containing protein [Paraphysoderma sedebokerense]|nr:ferric reductase NAD binding domain-containing protein [Paraphysoderma sedebokerense]